jgi:hypothetical protein
MNTRFLLRFVAVGFAAATAAGFYKPAEFQARSKPSRYLYLWAGSGTSKKTGVDIIAVVDADPASPKYGSVINALTVDTAGRMPHHSEFNLPARGPLFVNDFSADRSYLIDYANPTHPRLAGRMMPVPAAHTAHSFARLPNGHVIATIQFGDGKVTGNPGGLGEFDANGKLVRYTSSVDPTFSGARIRTYALTILPAIDRIVTTSSAMDTETVANTVQVWRMSDLKLMKTLDVPKVDTDSSYKYPFEVRAMPDGRTAMVNTYTCGFYHVTNLDSDPKLERVMAMQQPKNFGCSVPVIAGHFMLMPIAYAHRYATLDISNPSHPVEVSSVSTDTTFYPHWVARDPGSDRVVVDDQGDGAPFVMIGHFDASTGKLTWDERFRDAGATKPGVSFMKDLWPNGLKGMMMPHGAVFVP